MTEFYVSINLGPKWPILVSQCGMDHQKPTILMIFGILVLGGCGGQSKLYFWKLVLIIKMSTSQDFKTTFKYNLTCIFLSLRANLKNTLQCETPCIRIAKNDWRFRIFILIKIELQACRRRSKYISNQILHHRGINNLIVQCMRRDD